MLGTPDSNGRFRQHVCPFVRDDRTRRLYSRADWAAVCYGTTNGSDTFEEVAVGRVRVFIGASSVLYQQKKEHRNTPSPVQSIDRWHRPPVYLVWRITPEFYDTISYILGWGANGKKKLSLHVDESRNTRLVTSIVRNPRNYLSHVHKETRFNAESGPQNKEGADYSCRSCEQDHPGVSVGITSRE